MWQAHTGRYLVLPRVRVQVVDGGENVGARERREPHMKTLRRAYIVS